MKLQKNLCLPSHFLVKGHKSINSFSERLHSIFVGFVSLSSGERQRNSIAKEIMIRLKICASVGILCSALIFNDFSVLCNHCHNLKIFLSSVAISVS